MTTLYKDRRLAPPSEGQRIQMVRLVRNLYGRKGLHPLPGLLKAPPEGDDYTNGNDGRKDPNNYELENRRLAIQVRMVNELPGVKIVVIKTNTGKNGMPENQYSLETVLFLDLIITMIMDPESWDHGYDYIENHPLKEKECKQLRKQRRHANKQASHVHGDRSSRSQAVNLSSSQRRSSDHRR